MSELELLLAEDDEEDAELALAALKLGGLSPSLARARDGAQALELLRRSSPPRLVLLDLKMPKLSGLDVLAERRKDPALMLVPVVVLTSSKHAEDVRRCYELGANSYVVKPVAFEEFADVLGRVAYYWLRINVCQRAPGQGR